MYSLTLLFVALFLPLHFVGSCLNLLMSSTAPGPTVGENRKTRLDVKQVNGTSLTRNPHVVLIMAVFCS